MPLHIELLRHQLIRDRLLAAYPDLDQETLLDTLEGASDLKEMLGAITRAYLEDRAFTAALKQRLDDMRIRLSRLETATANKRELIAEVRHWRRCPTTLAYASPAIRFVIRSARLPLNSISIGATSKKC